MKNGKGKKSAKKGKLSDKELLSLVALQLKDKKDWFPEKTADAKEYIRKLKSDN
jgi:hypothetical protein